jgi:hypothetical protein
MPPRLLKTLRAESTAFETPMKCATIRNLKLVGLIHPAAETGNGPLWSRAEDAVAVSS